MEWHMANNQQDNHGPQQQLEPNTTNIWHQRRIVVTPKNVSEANYDTGKAITSTIDYLETKKIIIQVQHVKRHQDRRRKKKDLPKLAQMIIEDGIESTIALETDTS
jgi:hypothetical protein